MNSRRLPLIVGLVLAIGTGTLLVNYMNSLRAASSGHEMRSVVVATKDIPARVVIEASMLQSGQRASDQVDSDAIPDTRSAVGSVSLITIPAGSVVTRSKVGRIDALAIPRRLGNGLRAISISIDRVKGVAGLIQPGDRVDVIAVPPRVGNETPLATSILRGALVLAVGGTTETAGASPSPDQNLTTVTLAVTPRQANLLSLADVNTTLRLALRSPEEPIRSYPAEPLALGVTPTAAPAAPAPAPAPPAAVAVAIPNPRPALPQYTSLVPVIDGDHFIEETGSARR